MYSSNISYVSSSPRLTASCPSVSLAKTKTYRLMQHTVHQLWIIMNSIPCDEYRHSRKSFLVLVMLLIIRLLHKKTRSMRGVRILDRPIAFLFYSHGENFLSYTSIYDSLFGIVSKLLDGLLENGIWFQSEAASFVSICIPTELSPEGCGGQG